MSLQEELERLFQTGDASKEHRIETRSRLSSKGIPVETLIDIVQNGGEVKTGIDIFNKNDVLLIEKNARITTLKPLLIIRQNGIFQVPINQNQGGLWDRNGRQIALTPEDEPFEAPPYKQGPAAPPPTLPTLEARLKEIDDIKAEAATRYKKAKEIIRKTIDHIKKSGGIFDMALVEHTVSELSDYLLEKNNAFSFMAKEIFLSDEFLVNHSINVCTISTAILRNFNTHFSHSISSHLEKVAPGNQKEKGGDSGSFIYYSNEEIQDMAIGFFLHDIGKTAISESILNKPSRLTEKEFEVVKAHSHRNGMAILNKNSVSNPFIRNIVKYHHAPLYAGEEGCYPLEKAPNEIPAYVKICKIADIYDAMTSKRSYEDALNPIRVVTSLLRAYAQKDSMLQFILHAFVGTVGIWPPGSIVYLTNQQMAYVLDNRGPIVLPFTDTHGRPLRSKANPIDFGDKTGPGGTLAVDSRDPLISPKEAYQSLPPFLKDSLFSDTAQRI